MRCDCCSRNHREDLVAVGEDHVCSDCLSRYYNECHDCGELHYGSLLRTTYGYRVCGKCLINYTYCDVCNKYHISEHVTTIGHNRVCHNCADKVVICPRCNRVVTKRDEFMINGVHYCYSCYDALTVSYDRINSYNKKPMPIFYKNNETTKLYLGVELEVDDAGCDHGKAKAIMNTLNRNKKHCYCKTDGSLRNGFEIVSHPCTLDYHIKNIRWEQALDELVELGYKSNNTDTCGLHVHLSKDAFGDEVNIMKFIYLVENFWDDFVKLSRRKEDQLNSYAKRLGYNRNETIPNLYAKAQNGDRYTAVNLTNEKTIEIRIFQGTLNYNTFIAALELCHALVEYVKEVDLTNIIAITWQDLKQRFMRHKELREYIHRIA